MQRLKIHAHAVQDSKAVLEIEIAEAHQNVQQYDTDVKTLAASLAKAKADVDAARQEWKAASKELSAPELGARSPPCLFQRRVFLIRHMQQCDSARCRCASVPLASA